VNPCPYYVISNEGFVRLNNMIETMNEQIARFENYLWENQLSYETNLSLPSSRLKVSLCDDDKSSFPLESDFIVHRALTDLEEVIDVPLTLLSLVASSSLSTPGDTAENVLTLSISPLLLAQCTGLKVGEPFRDDVSPYDEGDSLAWSKEIVLVEQYLEESPLDESCAYDAVVGSFSSPKSMNSIPVEFLDFVHIPSPLLPSIPLMWMYYVHILGDFRRYVPSINSYCAYLESFL